MRINLVLIKSLIFALVLLQIVLFQGKDNEVKAFTEQVIQRGATGEDVVELQSRLQYIGFYNGRIDGVFDWKTYWALRNFQYEFGLPIDGLAGKETKAKLVSKTKYDKKFVNSNIDKGNKFSHYGGVDLSKQSAPAKPKTQAPAQPKAQAPAQPKAQAPVQQKQAPQAQPKAQAPAQQKQAAPAQPKTQAPTQPRTQATPQQNAQIPAQQKQAAPAQPKTQAPTKPRTQATPQQKQATPQQKQAAPAQPKAQTPAQQKQAAPAQPKTQATPQQNAQAPAQQKQQPTKPTAANTPNGFSQNDINLLANAVYGESRGEPYVGQVAVAAVILNRINSANFPNTVSGVIFEPGAFTAVADGQIWLTPNEQAKKAVLDAINGYDPTGEAIYYFNPDTATNGWIWSRPQIKKIGKHIFCK
ncbi:cell wall hydrolase [Bacillus marasmi]|uniref:cell wall hydrolase n=1 Tax=Bacillus marasmi TaxID=1926279 RepID=UPI0011CCCB2A|nr:cell wall hydrolase [Bacillus marasmi]